MSTLVSKGSTRPSRPAAERTERPLPPRAAGRARLLRFACVGALATITQLGLLAALTTLGWDALLANGLALLAATQVNFALSSAFTWRDRHAAPRGVLHRWARFMAIIAATLLLNQGLFLALRDMLPVLVASALGSSLTALLNFILGDRFVFLA